jgi:hypothetical protein
LRRLALWALILLAVNGAYLAAFEHASIFYEANVVLHLALGLALALLAARYVRRYPLECSIFLSAALVAMYLVFRGNTYDQRWVLWSHILLAEGALVFIGLRLTRSRIGVAALGLLAAYPVAARQQSNRKSGECAALDGFRGRGREFSLRAVFSADQHRQDYSIEFLHGLGRLRPLP